MGRPRSTRLLEKSIAAMISALEIYNKPDRQYREESFSVLVLNAWELMVKARVLARNDNKLSAIQVYEKRRRKNGEWSKKRYLKRCRTGNPQTISLGRAILELEGTEDKLPTPVRANLDGLLEIRDNAVHFMNASPALGKRVHELGTAAVTNYVRLVKRWFDRDLTRYNFYLMPIGFLRPPAKVTGVPLSGNEQNLLKFLVALQQQEEQERDGEFSVAIRLDFAFYREKGDNAEPVRVTTDPNATQVVLTEEDIRKQYPWDYDELTARLGARYTDFKANMKYHNIRMPLKEDLRFVKTRFLDPGNPKSQWKDYYGPNIFQEFDKHYSRP